MGGMMGRLFREFAVTLSVAIIVSLARLAHDDAHDVRETVEVRTGTDAWTVVPGQRAVFSRACAAGTPAV